MVGFTQNADRDHCNPNKNKEVLVASIHLQFGQNDHGYGGSKNRTVDDDGKDPRKVFGDGALSREVPLDCEGEDKCACGDPDCDEDRDEKCGDQCSKLVPRCAQTKTTHDRVFLPTRGVLDLEPRRLPPAGLLLFFGSCFLVKVLRVVCFACGVG